MHGLRGGPTVFLLPSRSLTTECLLTHRNTDRRHGAGLTSLCFIEVTGEEVVVMDQTGTSIMLRGKRRLADVLCGFDLCAPGFA